MVAGALLLAALVAWRARYGISFFDDGHYASITLRLAQGAAPFSDEMTAQSLGFLIPALFAQAWHALFGLTGMALALRVLYVPVAMGVGVCTYRVMRPANPAAAAFLAAAVPLLAPPYNIIGLSYNTTALLAFLLCWALLLRAAQGGTRWHAFGAGVAAAVGAISYPPLVFGALALLATCAALPATRRMLLPALAGGALTAGVFAAWLLSVTTLDGIRAALHYSSRLLEAASGQTERGVYLVERVGASLADPWLLPLWALVGAVLLAPRTWKARRGAVTAIPLAAAAPTAVHLLRGYETLIPPFGVFGAAYLILLCVGLLLPVAQRVRRSGDARDKLTLGLALPVSLANTLAVAYFTSAAWQWAVPVIGLAPLLAVLVSGWFRMCSERPGASASGDEPLQRPAAAARATSLVGVLVILVLIAQLYATAFKDAPPLTLDRVLTAPAVAGIITGDEMASRVAELDAVGRELTTPEDGVLFVHGQLGYALVDARMVTNAVWLTTGPSDAETLAYFERIGTWPDVAFVASSLVASLGEQGIAADPLLSFLETEYERAGAAGGFEVYRRP